MTLIAISMLSVLIGQAAPAQITEFLTTNVGFSDSEVSKIQKEIVVKQLSVQDDAHEVAIIGVVRVAAAPPKLGTAFRDIPSFFKALGVAQVGSFSDPAVAADVASLSLVQDDIDVIRECELAECKFKLAKTGIDRVSTIDWNSSGANEQINGLMREAMVGYVTDYRAKGISSLIVYNDKDTPLSLEKGFEGLLAESPWVFQSSPELRTYLRTFPQNKPEDVEDLIFWTVEDFGFRPVTGITHAVILERAGAAAPVIISQKIIYASHYFGARFTVLASTSDGGSGMYVLLLDRALFDGKLGVINRRLLARGLRSTLGERLSAIQKHLEGK